MHRPHKTVTVNFFCCYFATVPPFSVSEDEVVFTPCAVRIAYTSRVPDYHLNRTINKLRPKSWGRTKSSTARVRYINPLLWLQYFILTRIELKFICFRMYATIRYGLKYVWDVWRTSRVGGKKLTTRTRPGKCRFLISFLELYRSSFLKGKLRLYTATWKRLRLEKRCIVDLV